MAKLLVRRVISLGNSIWYFWHFLCWQIFEMSKNLFFHFISDALSLYGFHLVIFYIIFDVFSYFSRKKNMRTKMILCCRCLNLIMRITKHTTSCIMKWIESQRTVENTCIQSEYMAIQMMRYSERALGMCICTF